MRLPRDARIASLRLSEGSISSLVARSGATKLATDPFSQVIWSYHFHPCSLPHDIHHEFPRLPIRNPQLIRPIRQPRPLLLRMPLLVRDPARVPA